MDELEKTKLKLRMMEISFEIINNSRNDMIKQLAEQELINEKDQKLLELIEKRIEELKSDEVDEYAFSPTYELQKLLEKSKK